jgi:hypothetical protein
MRIRKKIEISPRGSGLWQIWASAALALCLTPEVALEGLAHALSTAELPAMLLTLGLLSAAAERKK